MSGLDSLFLNLFISYGTLNDRAPSLIVSRLKRRGWLEIDKNRRYQLTPWAEEVLLAWKR